MADVGKRVLVVVVEDDDSMREAIERLMGAGGYRTAAYASAEALLANGDGSSAACIISDWSLPSMSGLELLDTLRARGGWPPFILITAHDAPALEEEAVRHGAAAYLAKPFRGTALLAAVNAVVNQG